jgi:hypothetical protein
MTFLNPRIVSWAARRAVLRIKQGYERVWSLVQVGLSHWTIVTRVAPLLTETASWVKSRLKRIVFSPDRAFARRLALRGFLWRA